MKELTLENLTEYQCRIADALWACDTLDQVNDVIKKGGIEFAKIYSLMIVASFDDVPNTEMAMEILSRY